MFLGEGEINKLFRITAASLLAFGWLFLTPLDAKSDDPLNIADQQIQQLEQDVQKLTDQVKTQELIDIAKQKYKDAVLANTNKSNAQTAYDNAVTAESTALSAKNAAKLAVDSQTTIVANKLKNKNDTKDALDIANLNLSNTEVPVSGAQGVSFRIYPLSRSGNTAYLSQNAGLMCQGGLPYFYTYAGDGRICGVSENIIGIFNATLTVPEGINDVYFAAYTDDGSRIYVDGVLEADQWREQGGTWGPYTKHFNTSTDKTLNLEIWWYNGGGPGIMTIGWGYNNIWTGIPTEYLSYGQGSSQQVIDTYNAAVLAQQTAQTNYNNALTIYNNANSLLITYNNTLTSKTTLYNTAVSNTKTAKTNLDTANTNYDNAITDLNTVIDNAQKEYAKQLDFEDKQRVAAAIALALANQPQPTPEPSIAPTPTPTAEPTVDPTQSSTPEQTKPNDPTPEPTPEITPSVEPTPTPEPTQTVEPSLEPSPQPTDTKPIPTPEPTQDVHAIVDKTENAPISNQMANLIADLTNSNTLTKLSPEQKAAVAQTLGINPTEIAKVAEIAKSNPAVAIALQEFGDRANANLNAPMPYTLADATTEIQAEAFLSDPLGAVFNVDPLKLLSNFSELGSDMTDDQREKVQEVIIPVVIVSNIVSAVIGTRR